MEAIEGPFLLGCLIGTWWVSFLSPDVESLSSGRALNSISVPGAPGELIIYPLLWAQQALTFLLSHRPAELATKYANFSEGACKPGYASALMTAIFPR